MPKIAIEESAPPRAGSATDRTPSPKPGARGALRLGKPGPWAWLFLGSLSSLWGCTEEKSPALSHSAPLTDTLEFETPELLIPKDKELLLGAITDTAPIYVAAHKKAPVLGHLHAGETVRRSEEAHENDQCITGWYRVAPRGYMCTEKNATTNLEHPTLQAMSLTAKRDTPLPFTYAQTSKITALYKRDGDRGVALQGRLPRSTHMAIVGSWTAPDETREPQRLGLLTDGSFVRADDLRAASPSEFSGVKLSEEQALPIAYVVRRGVRAWKLSGSEANKSDELQYHERLNLTGRYRTVKGQRFWAVKDGRWVRHRDVTAIRRRHELPEFATGEQKWLDISVITGTMVAYEGKTPVFATLVSVGRDRVGDPETTASTKRGTFRLVSKALTRREVESRDAPLRDAPWALELESGQFILGAPHHDRFGIEHTGGDIEVAPQDGQFLFQWSTPALPEQWHALRIDQAEASTIVEIRK